MTHGDKENAKSGGKRSLASAAKKSSSAAKESGSKTVEGKGSGKGNPQGAAKGGGESSSKTVVKKAGAEKGNGSAAEKAAGASAGKEGGGKAAKGRADEPVGFSNPAIAVNLDACIACGACVRACREVQVNDVIGMAERVLDMSPFDPWVFSQFLYDMLRFDGLPARVGKVFPARSTVVVAESLRHHGWTTLFLGASTPAQHLADPTDSQGGGRQAAEDEVTAQGFQLHSYLSCYCLG